MTRALARRLVVGLAGAWPTAREAAWLERRQPAGVILFSRNIKNYNALCELCDVLHQLVPGLEIVTDHEGGPVSHLAWAVGRPPAAWSLGVLDDVGLTARVFEETGRRLAAAGIDRLLAPVADVLTEPRNPVIGARAFGADPALVTRHTAAAVSGLLSAGIKVCLKHWPGHGGSSRDSHLGEAEVGQGAVDAPFRGGLEAGADAVMVGHLLPAGEGPAGGPAGTGLPATLHRAFLDRSRRQLAGHRGRDLLLFADDITMGALGPAMARLGVPVPAVQDSGLFDPGVLPAAWFAQLADAGCDRLLIRGIPEGAFPGPETPGEEPAAPAAETREAVRFSPGPYQEARRRLWAGCGTDFANPDEDLLWLDFSRGDRWEVAGGQDGPAGAPTQREMLDARLGRLFRSVSGPDRPRPHGGPWTRLLVSSHRPLSGFSAQGALLAPAGVCLVSGHPSLKTDLEGFLGPGWDVRALYDITAEDLPGTGTFI